MSTLVLTVIGDDRSGLVTRLSDTIAAHRGNWTTSSLAQLAGKFAGVVVVDVPDDARQELIAALAPLSDTLQITVHDGAHLAPAGTAVELSFVGDDREGIVRDITDIVNRNAGSIESITSDVTETPMAGGQLFTARAIVRVADAAAAARLQDALHDIADELMVDVSFDV